MCDRRQVDDCTRVLPAVCFFFFLCRRNASPFFFIPGIRLGWPPSCNCIFLLPGDCMPSSQKPTLGCLAGFSHQCLTSSPPPTAPPDGQKCLPPIPDPPPSRHGGCGRTCVDRRSSRSAHKEDRAGFQTFARGCWVVAAHAGGGRGGWARGSLASSTADPGRAACLGWPRALVSFNGQSHRAPRSVF